MTSIVFMVPKLDGASDICGAGGSAEHYRLVAVFFEVLIHL